MSKDIVSEPNRMASWADFLKTRCRRQIGEINREYPHLRSLYIDYREVEKFGSAGIFLADEILSHPEKVIEDILEAIKEKYILKTADGKAIANINVRFTHIAKKRLLRDLRYEDVGTIVAVDGAVVHRASEVQPRLVIAAYQCAAGHPTYKHQMSHTHMVKPNGCSIDGCTFKKLEFLPKRSTFTDQQKLKIQDGVEGLKPGQQPLILDGIVLDDCCDQIYAGERATFNAIVKSSQRIIRGEESAIFDLYLEISSIEFGVRDFEEIGYTPEEEAQVIKLAKSNNALDILSQSIAPSIWGHFDIKKALAIQMFGGVTKIKEGGQRERGEIHITLLGDYGCGKTELAEYACLLNPRGVFISGPSSSAPGLIGATKQDPEEGGRWFVEPGELPMADHGLAAIDEIDKADKETLNVLYNVMQEGKVRISKAAKRTLNARTSLILMGNPKYQKFDPYADIIDQITIPPALLNRSDLIFIMIDKKDNDDQIAKHILNSNHYGECVAANTTNTVSEDEKKSVTTAISPRLMKVWIAYAKNTVHPIMNADAMAKIEEYYLKLRGGKDDDSKSPVTPRQLGAIIRLSEGMAKLRLSSEVTLKDVDAVLEIFDACMKAVATDPQSGKVDLGRIGHGTSQTTLNLIGTIKELIRGEPGISLALLTEKLDARGYKDVMKIKEVLGRMLKEQGSELMETKYEHYKMI